MTDAAHTSRNILLAGMMGSGKSTVGRLVATLIGRTFIDTDAQIERAAGRSIAEIFADDGEPAFRAREREVVAQVAASRQAVISLGGGVVVDPLNVTALKVTGMIVFVDAPISQLVDRLSASTKPNKRPLLQGEQDPAKLTARLTAMHEERHAAYVRAADYILDAKGRASDEVAAEVYEWARLTPGILTPEEGT